MKFPIIHWSFLPVAGIALFPFILVKKNEMKRNQRLVNHELIHLRQQMELFILPFYVLYLLNYFLNLIYYMQHDKAYRNIVFEREAYQNDSNLIYLKSRRFAAWIHYFRSQP